MVFLVRRGTKIETTVYRKRPINNIYLNYWGSFAPVSWRMGTLKTLLNRAYTLCSTEYHIKKETRSFKMFSGNITITRNGSLSRLQNR